MLTKVINSKKSLKILFSISTLLIFLDSYQVSNIPLTWAGNVLLTTICLLIYKKENMKFDLLISIILLVTLVPTAFGLFSMVYNFDNLFYLGLRIFSYLGFVLVFFVTFKFDIKK